MRLIDADLLKADYFVASSSTNNPNYLYVSMKTINDAPTVDAVEVVHGEWEVVDQEEPRRYGCSVCKRLSFYATNYCPNCGAKMDGEVKHE